METGPVSPALRFLDMAVDRVANMTDSIHKYEGHLRVTFEGHDIAAHDLDQVFDNLGCGISLSGGLGKCV